MFIWYTGPIRVGRAPLYNVTKINGYKITLLRVCISFKLSQHITCGYMDDISKTLTTKQYKQNNV